MRAIIMVTVECVLDTVIILTANKVEKLGSSIVSNDRTLNSHSFELIMDLHDGI